MVSKERLCLTADRKRVVPEGHPEATYLLVGAGCELDEGTARQFGLVEDKAVAGPQETKVGRGPAGRFRKR